jgi:hypothetical protein
VEATLISASIALQVAAKCMMLKSISKSKQIIGENLKGVVFTGTVSVPAMTHILNQSY